MFHCFICILSDLTPRWASDICFLLTLLNWRYSALAGMIRPSSILVSEQPFWFNFQIQVIELNTSYWSWLRRCSYRAASYPLMTLLSAKIVCASLDMCSSRTHKNPIVADLWNPHPIIRDDSRVRSAFSNTFCQDMKTGFWLSEDPIGEDIICPRDGRSGCALVDWIPGRERREQTHFMSWTWKYSLQQVKVGISWECWWHSSETHCMLRSVVCTVPV